MKRYEKFVLEAEKGINFEVSEGTSGELIIRAMSVTSNNVILEKPPSVSAGEYAKVLSVYTDKDGNKAVVPPGWTVSGVKDENTIWGNNKGLVIYRIPDKKLCDICWTNQNDVEFLKLTYDQMVWVPVSLLEANGTLDGISFTEKFGRRNYQNASRFYETLTDELLQIESVKKYGGFYLSRYNISKNKKTGKPQSVKGFMPWVAIDFDDAKKLASTIEDNETVKSHLTLGAEYDSILEWFIQSKARSYAEIAYDSSNWGNYWNRENLPRKMVKTGREENWCTNNIYDFAGNVDELTQERHKISDCIIRGGDFIRSGYDYPVAYRNYVGIFHNYCNTGFRVALYIK